MIIGKLIYHKIGTKESIRTEIDKDKVIKLFNKGNPGLKAYELSISIDREH